MSSLGVAFASHTSRGGPFVVGSHQLVRALAERGHDVMHIARPFTLPELFRIGQPAVRRRMRTAGRRIMIDGVPELLPIAAVPMRWGCHRYLRTGHNTYLRTWPFLTGAVQRAIGSVDALIVDEPRMAGIQERVDAKTLVYRATDLTPAISPYGFAPAMEARLAAEADGLVATSQPVLSHLQALAPGKPSLLLENGVDVRHFADPQEVPPDYEDDGTHRLVYAGALDGRFDADAVCRMAARSDTAVYLIGPVQQLAVEARHRLEQAGAHLLGTRSYERLPGYLQHADVGIIPLGDHPANRGRSPMKVHEYLAAGLPVLATRTEELERRATPHVHLFDRDMDAALDAALSDPAEDALDVAQGHDWTAKAATLETFLEGLLGHSV